MTPDKPPRGGSRTGAGRKPADTKGYKVRLVPADAATLKTAHGSLTKALKTLLPKQDNHAYSP